jgi:hypothetical protein
MLKQVKLNEKHTTANLTYTGYKIIIIMFMEFELYTPEWTKDFLQCEQHY